MEAVIERSGGHWPTVEQIESSLSTENQVVKSEGSSSKPVVEFTNIAYQYPNFEVTRERYSFESIKDPDWELIEK